MSAYATFLRDGQPSVSIVMTTYNGAAFVEEAVCSVLSQGYQSLEMVIVDDGSTDATLGLLRDLAAADDRLQIYPRSHQGIASSRNEALSHTRAPLLTFLDQDDLCPPDRIARQAGKLDAEPQVAALFARTIMFGEGQGFAADIGAGKSQQTMLISAALFRREIFTEVGGFDPAYQLADDFDFVLRLLESRFRVEVEAEVGVLHRRHTGQRSADLATARAESATALARSVRRRRARGLAGTIRHPLLNSGSAC